MEVIAYILGKKIGVLYEQNGIVSFEYEQDFLNLNINISPLRLPFDTQTYINYDDKYFQTLAGVFFDSLPDRFGTKVLERYYESKGVAARELTLLQKLIFIGNRGMGAIEYEPKEDIVKDRDILEPLEIRKMYEASKKIIKGEATDVIRDILFFMDSGASAGGARAKAVVGWNIKENMIISGSGEIPEDYEHWLIKFDSIDDDGKSTDFSKLEYLYMSMAKKCAINIPKIKLFRDNELSHFAIKRFDRNGSKKIHMHSLASLMHIDFNIPLHFSYDEAIRVVWNITRDKRDVLEFYKRTIFNVIARNQDDHAKNTSFLMDEKGEWRLSPAYDITYANGLGFTQNHQMSIIGKTNDFTFDDLLVLAKKNDIKESIAQDIIYKTIDVVSNFRRSAVRLGIREDLIELVNEDLRVRL